MCYAYASDMQTAFHHAYHHRTHPQTHRGKFKKLAEKIDDYAFLMGFVAVAVNLPQLITVWTRSDVSGVSLFSWAGFLLAAIFWLIYGILHEAKTLIVINSMLIIVQGLIVIRLLIH